jgi:two-component system, NarL family, sensor kinase
MNRTLLMLLLVAATRFSLFADDNERDVIDSLKELISITTNDSVKVGLLNVLSQEFLQVSKDSSEITAQKAAVLAWKLHNKSGLCDAIYYGQSDFFYRVYLQEEERFTALNAQRNVAFVLIILFLALFFLWYNKYQLREHTGYRSEISRQQMEVFTASVTTQDKERKRIAEDLHDGLGSILSTVKLTLERMDEEQLCLTPGQLNKYNSTLDLLNDAITEVRNISHNLMPASLSKLGLAPALKNLFDNITAHSKLKIHFSTHELNERLHESAEISIYRIILELMNNVVRHSKASEVSIQLIQYPDYINITIEDNGEGFDVKKARMKEGIGLSNISSRVEFLNGKLDFDSGQNGTTVVIEIPLSEVKLNG